MADSAKPILIAGAIGGVALLGVAWMFAASTSESAMRNATIRAEALNAKYAVASPASGIETAEPEKAEAEEPKAEGGEPEKAEAEEPKVEETEAAEAPKEETSETASASATTETAAETAEVAAATETATAAAAGTEENPADEATQTASIGGDAVKGKKVFKKCQACHMVGDGAKNKVGPVLNGIIGRAKGEVEGFKYSKVFEEAKAAGETWTPEALDAFLTKPRDAMKGTKMAFAGLRKEGDRTDVMAYLESFK